MEIALLISDKPKTLSQMERIGNFLSLHEYLGDIIPSFHDSFEYFVQLGKHISKFSQENLYFSQDLIQTAATVSPLTLFSSLYLPLSYHIYFVIFACVLLLILLFFNHYLLIQYCCSELQ